MDECSKEDTVVHLGSSEGVAPLEDADSVSLFCCLGYLGGSGGGFALLEPMSNTGSSSMALKYTLILAG